MLKGKTLAIAATACLLAACSSTPTPREPLTGNGADLDRADFGDTWPLTVDSGTVYCLDGAVTFYTYGHEYTINGTARTLHPTWPTIDEIWAPNPDVPGTSIDISPVLDAGLALCDAN